MNLYEEYLASVKAAQAVVVPVPETPPEPPEKSEEPAEDAETGESEERTYERVRKCNGCRRPVDEWRANGPTCRNYGQCEIVSEAEAWAIVGEVFEGWQNPDWLNPPTLELRAELDAKALRTFLEQVVEVADTARVSFEDAGWHVKTVDPAHVEMLDVLLPRERFETYALSRNGVAMPIRGETGVDAEKLLGAVKKRKGRLGIAVTYGPGGRDRMTLAQDGYEREVGLVDPEPFVDPKVPPLNLPARVAVDGTELLRILKDAGEVSDHIAITAGPTGVTFVAEGDVDKYRRTLAAGTPEVEYLDTVREEYRSLFPLDYLASFVKSVKGSRLVLSLGADYPLRIEWDGPETRGTWLCAPRIESE